MGSLLEFLGAPGASFKFAPGVFLVILACKGAWLILVLDLPIFV